MAMKTQPQVNLMLIASGGGTDANAIMSARKNGWLPEIGGIILVSTHVGAGCLEKATLCDVQSFTVVPPSIPLRDGQHKLAFAAEISVLVKEYNIGLIFCVGCRIVLPLIGCTPMYNIHPADPVAHGGNQMHSLAVHEHVLMAAVDEIKRGKKTLDLDDIFTYPTVHEVTVVPDDGASLLQGAVVVPAELLRKLMQGKCSLRDAADELQQLVLPYEWMMLPTAVRMAAHRILTTEPVVSAMGGGMPQ